MHVGSEDGSLRFHTHRQSVLQASHTSQTQHQPGAHGMCSHRGSGETFTFTGGVVSPAPSHLMVPEILTEASVTLVPKEETVVLPGDKSLQSLPFSSEKKVLLSESPSLQVVCAPLTSHCVTAGDSSQLSSGSGCLLYFLLDQPAELCSIPDETNQIKVTDPNCWILLQLNQPSPKRL